MMMKVRHDLLAFAFVFALGIGGVACSIRFHSLRS